MVTCFRFSDERTTGGDGANPTAFYNEWNSSTRQGHTSDEVTVLPESDTIGSGSEVAELPRRVNTSVTISEGAIHPEESHLRPTAFLPALQSNSRRTPGVQANTAKDREMEKEERVNDDGLFDLSTVTGWRQEMTKGSTVEATAIIYASTTRTPTKWITRRKTLANYITTTTSTITITTTPTTATASITSTTSITTTESMTTTDELTTVIPTISPPGVTVRRTDGGYIEPTFVFTTSSPRRTKHLELTTTLGGHQEEQANYTLPSHFFQLEDYPAEEEENETIPDLPHSTVHNSDGSEKQGEVEITEANFAAKPTIGGNAAVRAAWLYRVSNSSEEEEEEEEEVSDMTDVAEDATVRGNLTQVKTHHNSPPANNPKL